MSKVAIMIANGCEEIEALTVVDILRRASIDIDMVSIADGKDVVSSHRIAFVCDRTIDEINKDEYDGVILPGGMPGTENLRADERVADIVKSYFADGKLVAAICAAPSVLGDLGVLDGKRATCHPGFEDRLGKASFTEDSVAVDGNVITSRGMGTAIDFGLAILDYLGDGSKTKDEVAGNLVYQR